MCMNYNLCGEDNYEMFRKIDREFQKGLQNDINQFECMKEGSKYESICYRRYDKTLA